MKVEKIIPKPAPSEVVITMTETEAEFLRDLIGMLSDRTEAQTSVNFYRELNSQLPRTGWPGPFILKDPKGTPMDTPQIWER